jgi:hypothetical protein
MKVLNSLLLNKMFFTALVRLGEDPSIPDDERAKHRYKVMRSKRILTDVYESFLKERNDFIKKNGKLQADDLMARIDALKADTRISNESKRASIATMESTAAEILCGNAEEQYIIPKSCTDKNEELAKRLKEWESMETEIILDEPVKLTKKSNLNTLELEAIHSLITFGFE